MYDTPKYISLDIILYVASFQRRYPNITLLVKRGSKVCLILYNYSKYYQKVSELTYELKNELFIFTCMTVLPTFVHVHYVCVWSSWRSEVGYTSSKNWNYRQLGAVK